MKRPLAPVLPAQIRTIPRSFAWLDHRLRAGQLLEQLEPEDIGLYFFLAIAADRRGLSSWRLDRIERFLPCFPRHTLWNARDHLLALRLIAFRPWRPSDPDGTYQILPVPET